MYEFWQRVSTFQLHHQKHVQAAKNTRKSDAENQTKNAFNLDTKLCTANT